MTKALDLATEAINQIDPLLKKKFLVVAKFLLFEPDLRPSVKGGRGLVFGSQEYFLRLAEVFVYGRHPKAPQSPSTVPDELVSVVLNSYFNIDVTMFLICDKLTTIFLFCNHAIEYECSFLN